MKGSSGSSREFCASHMLDQAERPGPAPVLLSFTSQAIISEVSLAPGLSLENKIFICPLLGKSKVRNGGNQRES